ncbi:MAG: hypothetical protein LBM27_06685 [Lactobacillaceae bacterium]|jgi:hypothetical protein|nr:hypothetical protein [Lactobacillaceae bacterium]
MNKVSKSLLLASTLVLVSTASVPSVNAFADTTPTITYQTPDTTNSISFGPVVSDTNSYADPTLDAMRISNNLGGASTQYKYYQGVAYTHYNDEFIPGWLSGLGSLGVKTALSYLLLHAPFTWGNLGYNAATSFLDGSFRDHVLRVYLDEKNMAVAYQMIK